MTPTPWKSDIRSGMGPDGTQFVSVCTGDGKRTIASLGYETTDYSHLPDAKFIVCAVNNHDALLMALTEAIQRVAVLDDETFSGWLAHARNVVRRDAQ